MDAAMVIKSPENLEHLELSTRLLIEAALKRDLLVELLDAKNNFIRLSGNGNVQLVKQATKTAIDSYMTYLVLENKEVCKRILFEGGAPVPGGIQVTSPGEAGERWSECNKSIVVKPTTTNFGIGINFLRAPFTKQQLEEAVASALSHDDTCLIEEFISGEEYRFLVIDYVVCAVGQRIPANIIGDGESSIDQLVFKKNSDPRRGTGHKKPLELIQIGEVEQRELSKQGLALTSIVPRGRQIFLRQNSNISTGGDSVDVTDRVHSSYKRVAEHAARTVGSRLTGVDMIAQSITEPALSGNHGIIEMNFNPVLFMHQVPHAGPGQNVVDPVLDLLGF
jgi:D-alanine-D-alanine ligase-like ATP-grasp enzyme